MYLDSLVYMFSNHQCYICIGNRCLCQVHNSNCLRLALHHYKQIHRFVYHYVYWRGVFVSPVIQLGFKVLARSPLGSTIGFFQEVGPPAQSYLRCIGVLDHRDSNRVNDVARR